MRQTIYRLLPACILLGSVTALAPAPNGWAVDPQAGATLKAYVNYADMVPDALLGAWQRTRHIEKSNVRDMQDKTEAGAWVIFRENGAIFLRNPDNGIETKVTVDSVVNNTAAFHYTRQLAGGKWCQEQLNLTADSDESLSGFQIKECYAGDKPYYNAFARVSATRQNSLPPL